MTTLATVTPPAFVKAAWYQPVRTFPQLKAMGINTLVGWDQEQGSGMTRAKYIAAATAAGLFRVLGMDSPGTMNPPDYKAEDADPYCLGWLLLPDEPNGAGKRAPNDVNGDAIFWRMFVTKPFWLSLDGTQMIQAGRFTDLIEYCKACSNGGVVLEDIYPVNNAADIRDKNLRIEMLASARDYMGGGFKIGSVFEGCDQDLGWLRPELKKPLLDTDINNQVRAAIARKIDVAVWFLARDVSSHNGYNAFNCTPAQVTAIAVANAMLGQPVPVAAPAPLSVSVIAEGYQSGSLSLKPFKH